MTLGPGLHRGVPMEEYLQIYAVGAGSMEHLAISPKHYDYMRSRPEPEPTAAQRLGTALHAALLEPESFSRWYAPEPDLSLVAPDAAKPRATSAYKLAVAELEAGGSTVLRAEEWQQVVDMRDAVLAHPHARALLERCPDREVTALWDENGIPCRARFDMLGPGVIGDVKTTRRLKDFSPWTLTRMGYYRQAAWYRSGAAACGLQVERFFFVAVENVAPYDVGVFALESDVLDVGAVECLRLLALLQRCERDGAWPGAFPDVQVARLTDAIALQMPDLEEED